jgi:hypothetical protein
MDSPLRLAAGGDALSAPRRWPHKAGQSNVEERFRSSVFYGIWTYGTEEARGSRFSYHEEAVGGGEG